MQLLLFGLALIFYFSFHSFLADQKVKNFLMKRWISKKYYRLFFNFIAVGSFIPIYLFYQKIDTSFLFVNALLQYIGLGMTIIGGLLLLIALRQYDLSEFAGTQQLKHIIPPPVSLKTSGINAIVRHPLYFAGLIIIWGFFLSRPTDLVLLVSLISTTYLYFGTKLEEKKLVQEFGEAYLKYQKTVGMLLPFLK